MNAHDPFGRCPTILPKTLSREGRIELIAQLVNDLVAGRQPDPLAATWFGSAWSAWLLSSKRADLLRDYLEIAAPPRSKRTPQAVYRTICRQMTREDDESETASPSTPSDSEP